MIIGYSRAGAAAPSVVPPSITWQFPLSVVPDRPIKRLMPNLLVRDDAGWMKAAAVVFGDAFNITLLSNEFGWDNANIRQLIDSAALSQSGTPTRLTLYAGSGGCTIDSMYIGQQALAGDPYDFDGGQVQVTVGSATTFSIGVFGSVVTDAIPFTLDDTKNLLISFHLTTPATMLIRGGQANVTMYFKAGASEASVSNVTGYTTLNLDLFLVSRVEVG